MTLPSPEAPPFEDHCSAATESLRGALTELYLAAGADPDAPLDVSREFGLKRNLAWKASRVIKEDSPQVVFRHLPGAAGLELLLEAFQAAGAPPAKVAAVREAAREYERMVALHAGDRETLELMLDSLTPGDAPTEPLEVSRRLAFRGNSGIWGLQAKVRLRTVFMAPNPEDPALLDLAQISGLIDIRRFRHGVAWPLFQRDDFNDDGSPREVREQPIEPPLPGGEGTMLMTEFCSEPLPAVRTVPTRLGTRYELAGGSLGNRGLTTCVQGSYLRRFAPRYADEQNVRGEFFTAINAPAETLLFDLVVHLDLAAELELEGQVFHADTSGAFFERRGDAIPCQERVRKLGTMPPRLVTPLAPRYGEIAARVYERLGWRPEEFRGMRFEMKFPPLPSSVVLSYALPRAR